MAGKQVDRDGAQASLVPPPSPKPCLLFPSRVRERSISGFGALLAAPLGATHRCQCSLRAAAGRMYAKGPAMFQSNLPYQTDRGP